MDRLAGRLVGVTWLFYWVLGGGERGERGGRRVNLVRRGNSLASRARARLRAFARARSSLWGYVWMYFSCRGAGEGGTWGENRVGWSRVPAPPPTPASPRKRLFRGFPCTKLGRSRFESYHQLG